MNISGMDNEVFIGKTAFKTFKSIMVYVILWDSMSVVALEKACYARPQQKGLRICAMSVGQNNTCTQCLKITQNVGFMIMTFWHFLPIIGSLKVTCMVTLFDHFLHFLMNFCPLRM